jgi:hypothetical protein
MTQNSRHDYYPYGSNDWILAVKNVYKRDRKVFADISKADLDRIILRINF